MTEDAPDVPAPRKCETPLCTAGPVLPDWDPVGLDQSDGAIKAWIFKCPGNRCGWCRVQPVKPGEPTPLERLRTRSAPPAGAADGDLR